MAVRQIALASGLATMVVLSPMPLCAQATPSTMGPIASMHPEPRASRRPGAACRR